MLCFFVYQLLYVIHGCSVNESLILKSKFSGKFFKVYYSVLKTIRSLGSRLYCRRKNNNKLHDAEPKRAKSHTHINAYKMYTKISLYLY